ncbi:MAG: thioredoxin family protein [Bacteroidia bacterium]
MWSRTLRLFILLFILGSFPFASQADVQFSEQPLATVQAEAKAAQKPYLVYVFQDKDRQCRRMARKTWNDVILADYISQNFLTCKMDMMGANADVNWIQEYEVFSSPSILFFTAEGKLLGKANGFLAPETLISMLEKHNNELNQKEEVRLWAIHYQENENPEGQAAYFASNTLSADEGSAEGHLNDLQLNLAELGDNFPAELPETHEIVASNEPAPTMKTRGMESTPNVINNNARSNSQIILEVPGLERFSLANYSRSRGDEEVPMNYGLLVGSYTSFLDLETQLKRFQRYWQDDVWVYCEEVNKTPVYKLLVGPYIDLESAETFAHAMYKFQKINPTVLNIEHLKQ